jgi:hypothetical protein
MLAKTHSLESVMGQNHLILLVFFTELCQSKGSSYSELCQSKGSSYSEISNKKNFTTVVLDDFEEWKFLFESMPCLQKQKNKRTKTT